VDVIDGTQLSAEQIAFKSDANLPFSVELELSVKDRDTIAELCRYSEGEARDEFALVALRIGVLAMCQARGQIDAGSVRREADRMLLELRNCLDGHAKEVTQNLVVPLKDYFDPTDGRFNQRVENLIKSGGDLERVLKSHVGNQDSELCKTLALHIGENSPLMKKLSPEQKDGLIATLMQIVEDSLKSQSEQILGQFSLDNQDGALCRLVNQLTEKQNNLGSDLKAKINDVVKELSLDDEKSFFSRVQQLLTKTSEAINKNLTLDDESSALARLQREVKKILDDQSKKNNEFQEAVSKAVNSLIVRRDESLRSTSHGKDFQNIVGEVLIPYVQRRGDLAEFTGDRVGVIKNCKKGDFVIELGSESAAEGAKIVVEAKEEKKYSLAEARNEIEEGRKNRESQVGIFIHSQITAPAGLDPFTRLGNDIFFFFYRDNSSTDIFLQVAFDLAKALCCRASLERSAQSEDFSTIDAVILDIEKRAKSLDEVITWGETIQSNAKKIVERAKRAREEIVHQVENLQNRLTDLKASLAKN